MLQDILSSKLVRAGLIGCLLLIAGSLLYRWHGERISKKIADIPVSPYGFGPYPELPAGWPADQIWPCISANHELMMRVEIKLAHQGIDVMGSIMENGLVYPTISDTVYVEWAKTARRQYIRNMAGDPDACDRIRAIEEERGVRFTEADIPSDIKVLSFSEGGIAPYEFLDLPQRD